MSRLLGLVSQYASRFWSEGERDAGLGGGGGGGKGESFLRSLFSQSKRDVDAEHHFELYTYEQEAKAEGHELDAYCHSKLGAVFNLCAC